MTVDDRNEFDEEQHQWLIKQIAKARENTWRKEDEDANMNISKNIGISDQISKLHLITMELSMLQIIFILVHNFFFVELH